MVYQTITNFQNLTSDNMPRFITKKLIEVYDHSGNAENRNQVNKSDLKKSMLRSDLRDYSDADIVVKGTITDIDPDKNAYDKKNSF